MGPLLLALGLFAGWALIGLALLALVRADTSELRVLLVAPTLGACLTMIALFVFSEAGVAIERTAVPIAIVLPIVSLVVISVRRPRLHPGALAVIAVCVAGILLTAWPMFSLGFRWLGNGNDDMGNYVLSAQALLRHGLLSPPDVAGLSQGRGYAAALAYLHHVGARPGSDILLAFASRLAGPLPYEVFMPVIVAFDLCLASAVAALAMQVERPWWAAPLAAGLFLLSPLASYGVTQQLLAQVLGLGVMAALLALLLRPELHRGKGASVAELVPIGILAAGLMLGYLELVPEIGLVYLVYLVVLATRRRLGRAALIRLWLPAAAIAIVLLNSYFFTELSFLRVQSQHGLSAGTYPPLFGYALVPSALPGVVGLQTLPPGPGTSHLNLSIALAAMLLGVGLIASLLSARRGVGAAIVLVVSVLLAALLALQGGDFGLFKLSMYVQPFLAAAVAIWLSGSQRRVLQLMAGALLVLLVLAALPRQRAYVRESTDPENVPNLSARDLIPAFSAAVRRDRGPMVAVTENPVLIKLEAASADERPVYFLSRDSFSAFVEKWVSELTGASHARAAAALRTLPWKQTSFDLRAPDLGLDPFQEDTSATASVRSGRCELAIPGPGELPFNRYSLPSGSPDLVTMSCEAPRDILAFVNSALGESFYLPVVRRNVSFYQPQPDPFAPERTMAGFGRYALFQVLGATPGERLVLEVTDTFDHNGSNLLPPAAVVGSARSRLPLQGRGSARVFSAPLAPQVIAGTPYVLLDMGEPGKLPKIVRSGLQGLYGRSVPTDPRYLTTYVKDVSLVSAQQYEGLRPPAALRSFPADLENPALEYSGIYEDGWVGQSSDVRLSGGPAAELVVRGEVPAGAGGSVRVLLDGRQIAARATTPGRLNLGVAIAPSSAPRRVELRFDKAIRLDPPDLRLASAHLSLLAIEPRSGP